MAASRAEYGTDQSEMSMTDRSQTRESLLGTTVYLPYEYSNTVHLSAYLNINIFTHKIEPDT